MGLIPTFAEVTEEKLVGGGFLPLSSWTGLTAVKIHEWIQKRLPESHVKSPQIILQDFPGQKPVPSQCNQQGM